VLALAPGDPFSEMALNPNIPPEVQASLRQKFGLDDPVWQRYFRWLARCCRATGGFSFISRVDVDKLILGRVPVTLAVIGASQVVALMIALPVASIRRRGRIRGSTGSRARSPSSASRCPTFFTGLLLILLFSIKLDWLPFVFRADIAATGWQWWVGAHQAGDHAGDGARPLPGRELDALRALGGARRRPPRLRDDGAQQGPARAHGDPQACRAQRADPGR
jgi:peptide/nickel transport system permease protein